MPVTPPPPSSSAALVPRPSDAPNVGDDVGLQQLWLATQRRSWRSLALIGGSKGISTIETANVLAKIAWWYSGEASCVFDLRDMSLRLVDHQLRDIQGQVMHGERVFIALRSIFENPTAIPVARSADAVVMCVTLGKTTGKLAEQTLEAVGRDRFLGSILVGEANGATPKNHKKPAR